MIAAALPPMPPETESGAIVLLPEPIRTPELKSEDMIVLPEPLGVSVRLPFAPVAIVSGPESLKLLAESVWVAALIDKPLMVLVVAALMIPARVKLPEVVRTLAPEKKLILPEVPRVNVCPLVVPRVPLPERNVALLPVPEIEAVGIPPATLVKANLAELVALEPSNRSWVVFLSKIAPFP